MQLQWKLLSPFLKDETGHEAEYVRRLSKAILTGGDSLEIVLPRESGAVMAPFTTKHLLLPPDTAQTASGLAERARRKAFRLARYVRARARYRDLFQTGEACTLWLLHTANFDEIQIVLRAFADVTHGGHGILKIVLRADHNDDPLRKAQFRRVLRHCGPGVSLFADTSELAEEISKFAPIPVEVVPVPGVEASELAPTGRRWRFGYFGLRRRSKGFDRLASLVPAFLDAGGGVSLQVIVHGSAEVDAVEDHAKSEDSLRAAGAHIRSERLTTEHYFAALRDTEIVILPYDPLEYRYGSSGVFVDAVKAGCSVIVPPDTWMAKEAARNKLSSVFESSFSSYEQVMKVALHAMARRMASASLTSSEIKWMQLNSPQGLFERLR